MEIKLVPLKRGRDRYGVVVDGEMIFKTDYDILFMLGLFSKNDISDHELDLIKDEIGLYEAKKRAFYLLSMRAHGKNELINKLVQKGFLKKSAISAAEYMQTLGYIDDLDFAKAFSRSKSDGGWGVNRLRGELYRKGISRETIDEVLSDGESIPDGADAAYELIKKKLGGNEITKENKQKLYAFLVRRGFNYGDINSAMRRCQIDDEGDFDLSE